MDELWESLSRCLTAVKSEIRAMEAAVSPSAVKAGNGKYCLKDAAEGRSNVDVECEYDAFWRASKPNCCAGGRREPQTRWFWSWVSLCEFSSKAHDASVPGISNLYH
jgi:hypothetical protein